MVTTLTAKIETSVTSAKARRAAKEPRIAVTPMASGRLAAARLPKMTRSSSARIGREIDSANAMSVVTCSFMSRLRVTSPASRVVRPGAPSSSSMATRTSSRSSSSPRRLRTA
jgi:hypothetical protein